MRLQHATVYVRAVIEIDDRGQSNDYLDALVEELARNVLEASKDVRAFEGDWERPQP